MNNSKERPWDAVIVGGGASGMMAAVTAAGRGKRVLLIERLDRVGKKLLATGNGKCNYTNARMDACCFHGDSAFVSHILEQFSHEDCVSFFREIGIYPKQKNGYFYPNSGQALSVVLALEREMARLGVRVAEGAPLVSVRKTERGFCCETAEGSYRGRSVIFATGLTAAPKLGSDGSAIPVIRGLGHRFAPVLPALCGFYCEGLAFGKLSGVRCDALLTLTVGGCQALARERGELQLTDYGLSGIPVFQLSAQAARALYDKRAVQIHIDFLPEISSGELCAELARRRERAAAAGGDTCGALLCSLLHQKLIPVLLKKAGLREADRTDLLTEGGLLRLSSVLKDTAVSLVRSREMEYAQVCSGGIRTEEVDSRTLESLVCPGIYFAGELLDVDGICGGYNLQWAWSTGYVAGSHVK